MMTDGSRDDDDDLESMTPSTNLLGNSKKETMELPDIPLCGFLSVRYYQPYFDVDTADVISRIKYSLIYCGREQTFLSTCDEKPDAYGPFWISSSLVFTVAVASHMNGFFTSWLSGRSWAYDFKSVLTASSIVYGFAAAVPFLLWFILRQYETKTKLASLICVYGYSLTIFIPASIICIYPSNILAWLAFFVAGGISSHFILKNLGPLLVDHAAKQEAVVLVIALGAVQMILSVSLKLSLFYGS